MKKKKHSVLTEISPTEKWTAEYKLLQPTYAQFTTKSHELIAELLHLSGIDYHALESRVKDSESFREKIQRPGKSYKDPFLELPDLAALRIIAYYPDDIVRIREMLQKEFDIDAQHSSDKADELATDQFGYISVHEVITLTDNRKSMTEWNRYKDFHAEVQIRTVLQHAWASISHKLQYKHETDVPRILRRKLMRLSGLLELADEQFSELRGERNELTTQITDSIGSDKLDLEIDNDSVMAYLKEAKFAQKLKAEVKRTGFLSPPPGYELSALSQLISICRELKIKTLVDLDRVLRQVEDRLGSFFDAFAIKHPSNQGTTQHWVSVVLAGIDHGDNLTSDVLDWYDDYTNDVFSVGKRFFQ